MKKLISLILSLTLIACIPLNAFAEPLKQQPIGSEIAPCYLYTSSISSTLGIKNKTAECSSRVNGYPSSVTKIVVTQTLQVKSGNVWNPKATWSKTFNTWYCNFDNDKGSLPSGTYRLKTVALVYSGSTYEVVSSYSKEVKC